MAGRKLESAAQFQVGFVYSGHTVCLLWGASLCSLCSRSILVKGSLSLVIFFYLMGWLLCVGQSPRTSWLRGLLLDVTVVEDLVVEPVAITSGGLHPSGGYTIAALSPGLDNNDWISSHFCSVCIIWCYPLDYVDRSA